MFARLRNQLGGSRRITRGVLESHDVGHFAKQPQQHVL
jgi:hypothetical protein